MYCLSHTDLGIQLLAAQSILANIFLQRAYLPLTMLYFLCAAAMFCSPAYLGIILSVFLYGFSIPMFQNWVYVHL